MFDEGVALLANGQARTALDEFQKALAAAEGDKKADSFYNIAVCYARLGEAEKAVQAAKEALAIDASLFREMETDGDFATLLTSEAFKRVLNAAARRAALVGIKGWLLLPAVGLLVSVIVDYVDLVAMMRGYSSAASRGLAALYVLALIGSFGLWAFCVYVVIRFFGKKRGAPEAVIALLVANVLVSALGLMLDTIAGARALGQSIIMATIWIPYFSVSKRVRATFRY